VGLQVVVAGLMRDGLGLGEAARGYVRALSAAGHHVSQHTVRLPGRLSPHGDPGPDGLVHVPEVSADAEADAVIVCLNPPEIELLRASGGRLPAGRAVVGAWAWEVDPLPEDWPASPQRLDELWVHSESVARVVRRAVDVEVAVVPPPVAALPDGPVPAAVAERSDAGRPWFVALADAASALSRKNPAGAIEAFIRAFPQQDGPLLVVKVWGGDGDPIGVDALRALAAGRDDVVVLDEWLDRTHLAGLVGGASCLISLHRAEGFGLPVFEALASGVPVVVSDTGGPGDLLDPEVAHLVLGAPSAVPEGVAAYPTGSRWSTPDLGAAAEAIRRVWDEPAAARRTAEEGRALVADRLDARAVGAIADRRLTRLVARHASSSPRGALRPAISVITHAGTTWPALAPLLRSLAPQLDAAQAELVVGVSGPDVLPDEDRPPGVRTVDGGLGPFAQRAAALAAADGDLIVVTEDHCRMGPGWLEHLSEAAQAFPDTVIACPVGNGATGTTVDWASYLIGFSPWAPPILALPAGRAPTAAGMALPASMVREALGQHPDPGRLERELVPALTASGTVGVAADAIVDHTQALLGRRHLMNHFRDARHDAAAAIRAGGRRRSSVSVSWLRDDSRRTLRDVVTAVTDHPDLVSAHRRSRHWLRALALARAAGTVVGERAGTGGSGRHLD
jgi:hypothetical protein